MAQSRQSMVMAMHKGDTKDAPSRQPCHPTKATVRLNEADHRGALIEELKQLQCDAPICTLTVPLTIDYLIIRLIRRLMGQWPDGQL